MVLKHYCGVCVKFIQSNQKAIFCDLCKKWIHLKCTELSRVDYISLDGSPNEWFCSPCLQNLFPFNQIDDDIEFVLAIQDYNFLNSCYNSFKDLVFNPYAFTSPLVNLSDLDPDNQFYSTNTIVNNDSKYFTDENFITEFSSKSNAFSLIHFNARSLSQNFNKITDYLSILNFPFSVIGITETWLTDDSELSYYNIDHYNLLTCSRSDRHGGGVGLYLENNLIFEQLKNLESNDDNVCQSIFVELKLNNSNIIIGVIYRPPSGDFKKFTEYIDNTLSSLTNSNKSIHLMGDFNINLLNIETCSLTSDFFETMLSYSLCSSIFRPTRITTHSATLIDNIFSNNFTLPSSSGILLTDISDHLPDRKSVV